MLKQRVITALILGPLVIWGVLSLPALYFSFLILCLVALSSWEWGHLSGISKLPHNIIYTAAAVVTIALMIWFVQLTELQIHTLIGLSIAWWLYRIVLVVTYRSSSENSSLTKINPVTAISNIFSIVIPFYSLIFLRAEDTSGSFLLYLLLLIWGADIFAYFAGKHLGKNKLAPHVSPGKTWEGAIGALIGTLIITFLAYSVFGVFADNLLIFFALSLVIVVISIFGDLSESLYKRQSGLKDSGNLLPGHGGILDRVDSLIAAAPFYVAALILLGYLS